MTHAGIKVWVLWLASSEVSAAHTTVEILKWGLHTNGRTLLIYHLMK